MEEALTKLRQLIWGTDLDDAALHKKLGHYSVRIMWNIIRDVHAGQLNLRAMSLVYTTILSLVPLLAISFSVLKGFGVHEQLYDVLKQVLEPLGQQGVEIGDRIFGFVENVKVGVQGSVGLALLIYTVISLIQKIENSFNFIWNVSQTRSFARRFSDYLSVILVGPVLLFSAIGVKASLMNTSIVQTLQAIEPFGTVLQFLSSLLPIVLVIGAFTFIYIFMPNTRVRIASAFVGALAASLMWNAVSWAFGSFVVSSAQYTVIYSAFAALILFMLWLYFAWLVLLIGAAIAFYHQHPDRISGALGNIEPSPRYAERLGMSVLAEIAGDYTGGRGPTSESELSDRLSVPGFIISDMIALLNEADLILPTGESEAGWVPARPPDQISLQDALKHIRSGEEAPPLTAELMEAPQTAIETLDKADAARDGALAEMTLADIVGNGKKD